MILESVYLKSHASHHVKNENIYFFERDSIDRRCLSWARLHEK